MMMLQCMCAWWIIVFPCNFGCRTMKRNEMLCAFILPTLRQSSSWIFVLFACLYTHTHFEVEKHIQHKQWSYLFYRLFFLKKNLLQCGNSFIYSRIHFLCGFILWWFETKQREEQRTHKKDVAKHIKQNILLWQASGWKKVGVKRIN